MKALVDLPPILSKSTTDTGWYYAIETKTGSQFVFGSITVIDENWIRLNPVDATLPSSSFTFDAPVRRAYRVSRQGIDLQIDAIAWVAEGMFLTEDLW